jgi:NAD-dependent deacetylase
VHHPVDDDLDHRLDRAADALRRVKRVAVLTGAGVSAESGVATFRGAGGLWEGHRVEDVATPEAFRRDPTLVWRFYNLRRASLKTVRPNPGHYALAALEEHYGAGFDAAVASLRLNPRSAPPADAHDEAGFTLITQNIDGLHRAAGSHNVLEVHGNIWRIRCSGCEARLDRSGVDLPDDPRCPACGALMRVDVVWFGEMLPEDVWRAACRATAECQAFLVVGTSAIVYPAAGLIRMAQSTGAAVIEVNTEPTAASGGGVLSLYGPSGQILPQLAHRLGLTVSAEEAGS